MCMCVWGGGGVGKEGCFLGDPSTDNALLLLVKWRISVLRDAERNERKTATWREEAREDG